MLSSPLRDSPENLTCVSRALMTGSPLPGWEVSSERGIAVELRLDNCNKIEVGHSSTQHMPRKTPSYVRSAIDSTVLLRVQLQVSGDDDSVRGVWDSWVELRTGRSNGYNEGCEAELWRGRRRSLMSSWWTWVAMVTRPFLRWDSWPAAAAFSVSRGVTGVR